jgi:membrane protease YdiL (CAAX protease family)
MVKKGFQFSDHPGISITVLSLMIIASVIAEYFVRQLLLPMPSYTFLYQFFSMIISLGFLFVSLFGVVPFVFHLPRGRRSFREYLDDVGLSRIRPVKRTLLLFFSCYLCTIGSLLLGSYLYNHFVLKWSLSVFTARLFDLSRILPPQNWGLFTNVRVLGEEILYRGILLTIFLNKYSERKSIIMSSLLWSSIHALNILNAPLASENTMFVAGQILWTAIYGLFYGYLFIKTGNLYLNILVHYFGNVLMNLWVYIPYASIETTVVNGILFFGLVSTILSILWIKFISTHTLFQKSLAMSIKEIEVRK